MHTLNVYDASRLHKNVNNTCCVWALVSNWHLSKKIRKLMNCIASNPCSPRQVILNMGNAGSNIGGGGGGHVFSGVFVYKSTCLDIKPLPCNQIWRSLRKIIFEIVCPTELKNVWNTKTTDLVLKVWLGSVKSISALPPQPLLLFVLFIPQCPPKALSGIKIFYFEKLAKSLWRVLRLCHKFTDRVAALCATISKDFRSVWIEQANERLSKCKEIVHVQTVWNAHTA